MADSNLIEQRGRALVEEEERKHHRSSSNHNNKDHHRRPASVSKTPRRRNNTNPQSSSPPRTRYDATLAANNDGTANINDKDEGSHNLTITEIHSKKQSSSNQLHLSTPLNTLTTLLTQSHTHHQTTSALYNISHTLHLQTTERKQRALDALRAAQSELEHATTAEEFAKVELSRAHRDKDAALNQYTSLKGQVTKLTKQYKGTRIKLINLQTNSNWNGRCGTIVKMITEGEDMGRWKVKLDREWRGKEPDGNYDDDEDGGVGGLMSQDRRHVVARPENLELIDGGVVGVPSLLGRKKRQEEQDNDGVKEEGNDGKHYPLDPVEELPEETYHVVTPERMRGGRRRIYSNSSSGEKQYQPSSPPQQIMNEEEFLKRTYLVGTPNNNSSGYYNAENQSGNRSRRQGGPVMRYPQSVKRQVEPPQQQQQQLLQRVHVHPRQQLKQQQGHSSPPRGPRRSPQNSSNQQQQQQIYDRNRVSSFSEMISPEQFDPVTFQNIEPSDSFIQRDAQLPTSSFFEEASPSSNDAHSTPKDHHHNYQEESTTEERSRNTRHSPSQHSNSLPNVFAIPVEGEEDQVGPPTCIGVQSAGITHVNGAYFLTSNDNHEGGGEESHEVPPLYFKDAEPILLSDGRYYDMCILRIDCPDSEDHVIWFLSRVNVDPTCFDVKFSDCYYYCRVLRMDGLYVPPVDGWNVPDVQSDVVALPVEESLVISGDEHDEFGKDDGGVHASMNSSGLGIVPRTADDSYV